MQEINLSGVLGLFQAGASPFSDTNVDNLPSDGIFESHLNEKIASYRASREEATDNRSNKEVSAIPAREVEQKKPVENVPAKDASAEKVVDENGVEQKVAHTEQPKEVQQVENEVAETEVIKVNELIEKMNLNDEQVAELAYLLGVSVSDLEEMTIEVNADALINTPLVLKGENQFKSDFQNKLENSSVIKGILKDGTEIDIASLLELNEEGESADLKSIINKIATSLGLDESQAETMTKELGLQKITIQTEKVEKNNIDTVKELISQKGIATESNKSESGEQSSADSQTGEQKSESPFLEKKAGSSETQKETLNQTLTTEVSEESNIDGSDIGVKESVEFKKVDATQRVVTESVIQNVDGKEIKVRQISQVRQGNSETSSKIMSQIVEKAQILSLPNRTEAKITLTPAQLGSIDIKIMVQDAQVRGHIVVENQSVKHIVEQNIDQLKEALVNQGIDLSEVTVEINERKAQFQEQHQNGYQGAESGESLDANSASAGEELERALFEREQFRRSVNNSVVHLAV